MANTGFFLGGVADAMQTNRELGLRERALKLQEDTLLTEQQKALREQADSAITGTLDLIGKTIEGVKSSPSLLGGGIDQYREAIASLESAGSGGYQAEGPVTDSGDKAYGRYQVMGANIPQWTREVLGQSMTPEQFLASPEAQDKVFDAKFGQFIQQTGSVEDAASMWFTGRPLAEGANATDALGTTGSEYVQKFTKALVDQPRNRMKQAVEPLLRDVEEIAAKTGRDPARYRRQVEAMIVSTPTGVEKAISEGEAAAAKRLAEATGLMRAGIQRADALATAGIQTTPEGEGGIDPEKRATIEATLRDDYTKLAAPFIETRDAMGRIEAAANNPSAAGDVSLIIGYMKMLDPGSVVREGEFATAQNTAGVPGRIRNLYNQLLSGARLTEEQRADFLGQSRRMFSVQQKQYQTLTDQFAGIAKRTGVDPANVTIDLSAAPGTVTTGADDPLGIR